MTRNDIDLEWALGEHWISVRLSNVIKGFNCKTLDDLLSVTDVSISEASNAGKETVKEYIEWCAWWDEWFKDPIVKRKKDREAGDAAYTELLRKARDSSDADYNEHMRRTALDIEIDDINDNWHAAYGDGVGKTENLLHKNILIAAEYGADKVEEHMPKIVKHHKVIDTRELKHGEGDSKHLHLIKVYTEA